MLFVEALFRGERGAGETRGPHARTISFAHMHREGREDEEIFGTGYGGYDGCSCFGTGIRRGCSC